MREPTDTNRPIAKRTLSPSNPRVAWTGVAIWLVVVGCVSLTSDPPGLDWLVALSKRFASPTTALRVMQAVVHLALYGVGAILIASAIATIHPSLRGARLFFWTLATIMAIGLAIEIAQDYVPRRRTDLLDLSGDLVGSLLSLTVAWAFGLTPFRRHKKEAP